MTTSKSISYACDVNASANISSTDRQESLTEQLNRLEICVSNNRDDLLLIRSMIDQLRAISDFQVSLLINQSQVLREAHLLAQSLHVPTASVEIADPEYILIKGGPVEKFKELEQSVIETGRAGVNVRGITVDLSERTQAFMNTQRLAMLLLGRHLTIISITLVKAM